jgi:N-acetylglucosaminyldiphosphoundecaprenol N-acetyl-beta-D-mannosaminyltransferase
MSAHLITSRNEIAPRRVRVSGVPVTDASMEEVLHYIDANICAARLAKCMVITNTESMFFAGRNHGHAEFIERADLSCCDGIGVVLAGRAQGVAVPRLYGTDMVERCCAFGVAHGWRHYFYGGKPGVAEMMRDNLSRRFPGLVVAGLYSPPFRQLSAEEDQRIVDIINAAKPDIVWVGLGLLKQERYIAAHLGRIRTPWMAGVGAAFDYHAGTVRQAPPYFHALGLYWLYRLLYEPRMLVRNLRSAAFLLQSLLPSHAQRTRS